VWGARPSQILADQLTLFKLGGIEADYALRITVYLPPPPGFSNLPSVLQTVVLAVAGWPSGQ
jgi:hypothetical protein